MHPLLKYHLAINPLEQQLLKAIQGKDTDKAALNLLLSAEETWRINHISRREQKPLPEMWTYWAKEKGVSVATHTIIHHYDHQITGRRWHIEFGTSNTQGFSAGWKAVLAVSLEQEEQALQQVRQIAQQLRDCYQLSYTPAIYKDNKLMSAARTSRSFFGLF